MAREDASAVMRRPRGHCFPLKGPAYAYGARPMISALAVMASRLGLRNWMVTIVASRFNTHDSGFTIPQSCFGFTIAAVMFLAAQMPRSQFWLHCSAGC